MDRVGVEPTTSAIFLKPRISIVQIPPAPLCMLLSGQLQADVLFVRMNGSQHHGSRRKDTSECSEYECQQIEGIAWEAISHEHKP